MRVAIHLLFALMALTVADTATAAPLRVEVDAERITLADVVPHAPAPAGDLDLGPAPAPGQSRRLSRRDLVQRLNQALVSPRGLRLRTVVVVRPAQRLSEQDLQQSVRAATTELLGGHGNVSAVRVRGGMLLPRGDVQVTVTPVGKWRHGFQPVQVEVTAGASTPRRLIASVQVALPRINKTRLVERGAEVVVVARLPGVMVRTTGVAQSSGARGDRVVVLPADGHRTVRARVIGAATVEVEP